MRWNVNTTKCLRCGACVAVCATGALELTNGLAYDSEKCTFCGACEKACPIGAISLK